MTGLKDPVGDAYEKHRSFLFLNVFFLILTIIRHRCKHTCKYSLSLINLGCKLNWKWKHRQEACQGIFILLITELLLCVLHTCVALINSHKVLQRKLSFLPLCVYNHGLGVAKKKIFIGNNSSRNVWIMAMFVSDTCRPQALYRFRYLSDPPCST